MATIVDYLEKNGKFVGMIGEHEIILIPLLGYILMNLDGHNYQIDKHKAEYAIQDVLEKIDGTEIRFCDECGKPYDHGFMADGYSWYSCEDCFEKAMNRDFGKGEWRGTEEEGDCGGFYEYLNVDDTWEDTGIFYTEWN